MSTIVHPREELHPLKNFTPLQNFIPLQNFTPLQNFIPLQNFTPLQFIGGGTCLRVSGALAFIIRARMGDAMAVEISRCEFAVMEASPGFQELVDEYIVETANPALGDAACQLERYTQLDLIDSLQCVGVFDGKRIVGGILLLVSRSGHYGWPIVCTDSIFLAKAYRKGRTGLKMLAEARDIARDLGAPALTFSCPPGGPLEQLCLRYGMDHTHSIYAWSTGNSTRQI